MLNITNLYADYGGKPALEDINLTLDSGELLVVLGPSGCGKTTLLNLIAGFVPYQHGTIQLEGKKVEGPGAERGVVFQNEGLLPWRNVQENVAFGLQLAGINSEQRLEDQGRCPAQHEYRGAGSLGRDHGPRAGAGRHQQRREDSAEPDADRPRPPELQGRGAHQDDLQRQRLDAG